MTINYGTVPTKQYVDTSLIRTTKDREGNCFLYKIGRVVIRGDRREKTHD